MAFRRMHTHTSTYKPIDLRTPLKLAAPVINEAVKIVHQSGNQFHILVIVGDGAVSPMMGCTEASKAAIVAASEVPLSIIFVGVGDGPWEACEEFDDDLPQRQFDNFQFLPFSDFQAAIAESAASTEAVEAAFAVCAMQEVPEQLRAIQHLGLLGAGSDSPPPPADRHVPSLPAVRHTAAAAAATAAAGAWLCDRCTFENSDHASRCAMCNQPQRSRAADGPPGGGGHERENEEEQEGAGDEEVRHQMQQMVGCPCARPTTRSTSPTYPPTHHRRRHTTRLSSARRAGLWWGPSSVVGRRCCPK